MRNKVIAITGANGKIGNSIAKLLINMNVKLVLGDLNFNKYKITNEQFMKNVLFVKTDLTKLQGINKFIKTGIKKFNRIDACIHCAYPKSKGYRSKFENLNYKYLKEDLNNQLGSSIILSQQFMKIFVQQGTGNLIHFSSIQGISAPKFELYKGTDMVSPISYSAIKSGIISVTKYLAKYYKNKNIRINCISPGGIFNNQSNKFVNRYKKECNSKGLLDPDDINQTILFLLSEKSKYINGQNIIIDDGWSL